MSEPTRLTTRTAPPTAFERAAGRVTGPADPHDLARFGADPSEPPATPLRALEDAVRPALRHPGGCFVSFSGGHDSSLVLTVATRVARAEGLPLPVPVSWSFPAHPDVDETARQDALLTVLALPDRVRLPATDDLDALGPVARRVVRRVGVRLPANGYVHDPLYAVAAGGHLLLGSGGDEVFGRVHRPRRPWPVAARPPGGDSGWLRPLARRRARAVWARHLRSVPRATAARPRWRSERRDLVLRHDTQRVIAAHHDVLVGFPLADRGVLSAVERCGTDAVRAGGRTPFLQALFGADLPAAALSHRPKALFDTVFWGDGIREHARRWDGTGVDPALVDVDALRATWRSGPPTFRTVLLLHQTWLASAGPAAVTPAVHDLELP